MQNTKIFKLLATLSHPERQRFLDFLNSIYFNQNDALVKCFVALLPSLQKTKPIEQNEQQIWKQIYPSKKYDKARFHRVCSDLLKEAERFMAYFKFAQNKSLQNVYTLQSLNEKRAMEHLPHFMNFTYSQHKKTTLKDGDFYYLQYLIEDQKSKFEVNLNKRTSDNNSIAAMTNLDSFYIAQKLQYYNALLHYKSINSVSGEILLMNEIVSIIKAGAFENYALIKIRYSIFLTQTESENEVHFENLKEFIKLYDKKFSSEIAREMYSFAIQYCIKKINSGVQKFYQEIFNLYKSSLQLEVLFNNNEISPYEFKNIITTGLRVNEFTWTENFIKEYKIQLPVEHQENAYTFNIARVFFYRKEYDKVLNLLQKVEYNDVFYLLDSKLTLIKTFYELKEFESLAALLESFKMLIRRKKIISEQQRIIYSHFIQYVKKFISITDKTKLVALQTELQSPQQVADIGWLKEKVNELLENKKR
ncbi:MAG: hypothetical protein RJA07_2312 [Bacteroidota bacterium]|jgi:hypothetical protein